MAWLTFFIFRNIWNGSDLVLTMMVYCCSGTDLQRDSSLPWICATSTGSAMVVCAVEPLSEAKITPNKWTQISMYMTHKLKSRYIFHSYLQISEVYLCKRCATYNFKSLPSPRGWGLAPFLADALQFLDGWDGLAAWLCSHPGSRWHVTRRALVMVLGDDGAGWWWLMMLDYSHDWYWLINEWFMVQLMIHDSINDSIDDSIDDSINDWSINDTDLSRAWKWFVVYSKKLIGLLRNLDETARVPALWSFRGRRRPLLVANDGGGYRWTTNQHGNDGC